MKFRITLSFIFCLVRTLANHHPCAAGRNGLVWDGRNHWGLPVSSGESLCRFEAAAVARTQKMRLLK
jgi:hypothetical protein